MPAADPEHQGLPGDARAHVDTDLVEEPAVVPALFHDAVELLVQLWSGKPVNWPGSAHRAPIDMGGQPAGEYRDMVELIGSRVVPQLH